MVSWDRLPKAFSSWGPVDGSRKKPDCGSPQHEYFSLAVLELECDAFYNPRQYTMPRGVAVYDGPARVIAYPPRSKRRESRLVV